MFLRSELKPLVRDQLVFEAWLQALDSTFEGPRLGCCIAIDMASGAIPPSIYASILDKLPWSKVKMFAGRSEIVTWFLIGNVKCDLPDDNGELELLQSVIRSFARRGCRIVMRCSEVSDIANTI